MRKRAHRIIAAGLASVLAVTAFAGTAWAYFTDQVRASGEKEVVFGYDYETEEKIEGTDKVIRIVNKGATEVMARVLIFGAGDADDQGRTAIYPGDGWRQQQSDEGTCFVYTLPLKPSGTDGDATTELRIKLTGAQGDEPEDFQVVVVGQVSPVAYNAAGTSWYGCNWTNPGQDQ